MTRRLCLHNRYFPLLEDPVHDVENQFERWCRGNPALRRLCATISDAQSNNPNDTGYAYADGIPGNFSTCTESSAIPYFNARSNRQELFVQDNWRLTKRLTLDFGLRMSLLTPIYDRDGAFSTFQPGRYDPAKAVQPVQPATRQAYNAFNQTQYSGVNTETRFDAAGNQANALFGQMNAARSARIMLLALRCMF